MGLCDISAGRNLSCKTSVGGIKNIFLSNFDDITSFTFTADTEDTEIASFVYSAADSKGYRYELKGGNNLEQTITSSREAGTTFSTQTLTAILVKQDMATHKQVKLLSHGRVRVVVEDYNGKFFLMGLNNGCELTTAAVSTGTAMGDASGYTLTIVSMEKDLAQFVNAANETALGTTPFFSEIVTS